MLKRNLNYSGVPSVLIMAQLAAILVYFNANIVNVGEMGTALSLLAAYFGLSGIIFIFLWLQKGIYFRFHFLVFLFFLVWIVLRVAIDLNDIDDIKSITIGTTGGILTFYLAGAFFNISYMHLKGNSRIKIVQISTLLTVLILACYSFVNLISRVRDDIYFISDFNDDYQRSGNFLSISFVVTSIILISLLSNCIAADAKKKLRVLIWFIVYSIISIVSLASSQLFGSNSATAVITGIYIFTGTTILVMSDKENRRLYAEGRLVLPYSVKLMKKYLKFGITLVILLVAMFFTVLQASNFEIENIRLLGFGSDSGALTSLTSRFDILTETGLEQIVYAPLLGNMNVAHLVTGESGKALHSFLPFIFANLGLVGLFIALCYFFLIFRQLQEECNLRPNQGGSFEGVLTNSYFIFIFLFFFLFANLTVGVSWIVMWFTVGFLSQPFRFESKNHSKFTIDIQRT